ncbi:SEC-C metal-binding domain-containing protein [Herbidospora solisilvae]|uniref:SEC-C metal-binding domain-containing protein n=1 Tax=Herbidospora solisilvae TaxID=2696284 RepID=UPI002E2E537E|nr:SEC-C metal-binding domain-containing protein [Herbidospora solisilvae]
MLPDHLFGPLDLDAALERAYDRGEEKAAWELLADALMDPRARGDRRIPAYVVELIDDYTLDGWEQDTLDLLHDLIGVEPELTGPLRTPMAELHGQLGDSATALRLLRTRRAELARLPEDERDEEFYPAAAMIAGPFDPGFAADLLDEGLRLALDLGRPPATVRYLDLLRRRFGGPGPLSDRVEAHVTAEPAAPKPTQPVIEKKPTVRLPYVPGDDLRALEARFRKADLETRVAVVRLPDDAPVSEEERLTLVARTDPDGDVAWPPGRNDSCWCGSDRKYKKCCGSPV